METSKREFTHACILEVEVGTNTPQGGDTGHGGRTRIVLRDLGSTDIDGRAEQGLIEIKAGGDAEAEVLADALSWAGQELRTLMQRNQARS